MSPSRWRIRSQSLQTRLRSCLAIVLEDKINHRIHDFPKGLHRDWKACEYRAMIDARVSHPTMDREHYGTHSIWGSREHAFTKDLEYGVHWVFIPNDGIGLWRIQNISRSEEPSALKRAKIVSTKKVVLSLFKMPSIYLVQISSICTVIYISVLLLEI